MTYAQARDILMTAAANWRAELLDHRAPEAETPVERLMLEEQADDIEHALELFAPSPMEEL